MAKTPRTPGSHDAARASSGVEALLAAAMERGDESLETGRFIVTYKDGALQQGLSTMRSQGIRAVDARDFSDQAMSPEDVGDAEAVVFPEIGAALLSGGAFAERGMSVQAEVAADDPVQVIEPEYFVFADAVSSDYLRGFSKAAAVIQHDLGLNGQLDPEDEDIAAQALGATWGLIVTKAAASLNAGAQIRTAVLDTGMDLRHPDFAGRQMFSASFVGQPVQDLHSHGTHCVGTACGPKSPPGLNPRYGIAHKAPIFVGKVLTNSGGGTTASVLAGMNWAIANRCAVISMSLGSRAPVQAAYTAAGRAALSVGCLIIAAAGNDATNTGAPANSPTIMSVASLDRSLAPSSFSNFGKIEIAAPGRDVFSSVPMPQRYGFKSGTSMATPHVAGIAALWAETNPSLRGQALWNKLLAAARPLPTPPARVGKGLVQAP